VRSARGAAMADALVAAALAGVALAALASVAGSATRSLILARQTSIALAFAGERVEALRAGPRAAGTERRTASDGTVFTATWTVGGGRGSPQQLDVRVTWRTHAVRLTTAAFP